MQEHLANTLKALRKARGISQEQLADQCGVTVQAVSKWECAQSLPDITLLPVLADYFGVSIDRLLREYGIRLCTSARVTGIRPEGVEVLRGEHTEILPAQTIIAAFGQLPNKTEAEAFQLAYPTKTTLIGDCVQIGMSGPAIRGGFYAAMALQ